MTENHASLPSGEGLPFTATRAAQERFLDEAHRFITADVARRGLDAVRRDPTMLKEALATMLSMDRAAASDLMSDYAGFYVDWVLDWMARLDQAS